MKSCFHTATVNIDLTLISMRFLGKRCLKKMVNCRSFFIADKLPLNTKWTKNVLGLLCRLFHDGCTFSIFARLVICSVLFFFFYSLSELDFLLNPHIGIRANIEECKLLLE